MKLKNTRVITAGVGLKVSSLLQLFTWHCIDAMPPPKAYLQIFNCTIFDGKQKIMHVKEIPEYKREYLLDVDTSFFCRRCVCSANGTIKKRKDGTNIICR